MSTTEMKENAVAFVTEVLGKGNFDMLTNLVTSDFVYHARGETIEGVQNFKEWVASDQKVFSDIHYTVVGTITEYGRVATAFLVGATHDRDFRGIPASHKTFETIGVTIFHFDGNKIKTAWTIVDGLTPALELGLVKVITAEAQVS